MTVLINPATGAALSEIPDTSPGDVAAVVARSRAAFEQWREATPAERARVLLRVADLVERDAGELTWLEVEETGKSLPVMRDGELPFSVDNLRFFAGGARSLDGTGAGVLSAGYTSMLVRRPPALVFADADLAEMAAGVSLGATYNTGQDCTAATRVYVERAVYRDAVDALESALTRIRPGDPWSAETDIGPLVSSGHRDRVAGFVDRAAASGARIAVGGKPAAGPGFFFPPTLVLDAAQES